MIGRRMKMFRGEELQPVTIYELAIRLFETNNRFLRIAWHSDQTKRLKKTGDGVAYKGREVRKLYVAAVRNNYNFAERVRALLAQRGAAAEGVTWEPQERSWGKHVPGTPFVIHENTGGDLLLRLHGHFLVSLHPRTKREMYYDLPGETGYYVDGKKVPADEDKLIKSLQYSRAKPTTELDKARRESHPVNCRLDDIIGIKIGKWYKLIPPTEQEIQSCALLAAEHGRYVEEAFDGRLGYDQTT